jgi:hypothetical protein
MMRSPESLLSAIAFSLSDLARSCAGKVLGEHLAELDVVIDQEDVVHAWLG